MHGTLSTHMHLSSVCTCSNVPVILSKPEGDICILSNYQLHPPTFGWEGAFGVIQKVCICVAYNNVQNINSYGVHLHVYTFDLEGTFWFCIYMNVQSL